jgi:hypothetical protein
MPTFQLKPTQNVSLCGPTTTGITWTFERDTLPPLLEGKVGLSAWQDTFDAVVDQYRSLFNTCNMILHAPPCIFLSFPYIYWIVAKYEKGWLPLVRKEAETYKASGIQVTLVREPSKKDKLRAVGLEFNVNPTGKANNGATSSGEDVAAQLEKLAKLHETGQLSADEYTRAKDKVLNK